MANYVSKSTESNFDDKKKKQITPERIYNALADSHKGDLMGMIVISFVILVSMLIFVLVVNLSDIERKWATLITILLLSVPLFMVVASVYTYYRNMKRLSDGGYKLITDTAERIVTDDRYVRRGRSSHMEHAMYLYHCGRVVISLEETYVFSEGDKFFVVVTPERPNKAILAYNSKYYELVDLTAEG